ncbi:ubiquitin-like protein Pup [Corynebacterium bovis]|uniref:Prokaryotic ubiquitin-like protein Pup n=1 Tax=Corynebacterium bovis TaxID=36808 RepID=A0A426Q2P8_9CORY|nr:ubiquitin-like protein Pup [Corynebacterium bovis]RRO90835.1 ubiquitin-like protein Pup [Corynebacterium bovis]RRO97630.1 ubiquitin-like protein Pup [Corynebacterium bovis]RRO99038.1 ubiquitin-like protein Pup [Corynebacterium bovis]RRQ02166.1 ubiquitin-like protein Pup [Corynebacterium bovis]RRQ02410.1 ubiquitin-like protein Pup [Corynebacterium bovis]
MAGQTQIHGGGGHRDDEPQDVTAGQQQVSVTRTDDLLDEIDGLLESNAEDFVRSYVQKGGQ